MFLVLDMPLKKVLKKAEQEKAKSKPKQQPIMKRERTTIRIVMKNMKKTGKKQKNYKYHESKEVIAPFHQIIGERKKFSSCTSMARG